MTAIIIDEKWAPIKFFSQYEVSNLGNVRKNGGRAKKLTVSNAGYKVVFLSLDGSNHSRMVHRLVAFAFVRKTHPDQGFVRFKDGDKLNCRADNLEWAMKSWKGGYLDPDTEITNDMPRLAIAVQGRIKCRWTVSAIAEFYRISTDTVEALLAIPEDQLPVKRKVRAQDLPITQRILNMHKMKWAPLTIAKRLDLDVRTVVDTIDIEEGRDLQR